MNYNEETTVKVVRELKRNGMSNFEIAERTDTTEPTIKGLCHKHRITRSVPHHRRYPLPVTTATLQLFRDEATRRGKRFDNFMRDLLHTIAKDNLYSAIIDDGK